MAQRAKRASAEIERIDHFLVVEGATMRGATVKDMLQDPATGVRYIAKLGRRNNDLEVMTEYAISTIGRTLGVSMAESRVGRYKGQLRFLSRYFLDSDNREELVHGLQLFTELYDEATVTGVIRGGLSEQAMFSVQAVKSAFGAHYVHYGDDVEEELFGGFVAMLTHDALIGLMDRHHENWGVIVHRERGGPRPRFAPLYDSASGLFCDVAEKHLGHFSGQKGSEQLDRYVAKSHPLVGFDGLRPSPGWHYITHHQLLAAVFDKYPDQRQRITAILEAYDWKLVRDQISHSLGNLCSSKRLALILLCLRRRMKLINRTIHGREGPFKL